jgi:mRNA-degrading endonuclease RelE of RelBE toxin-antitoxin system
MGYSLFFHKKVKKFISELDHFQKDRVKEKLVSFAENPYVGEELASGLHKSISSISRQVTQLKNAKLIKIIKGSGGPNSPYKFTLTLRARGLLGI